MGDIGSRQVRFEVLPTSERTSSPGGPDRVLDPPVSVERERSVERAEPVRR